MVLTTPLLPDQAQVPDPAAVFVPQKWEVDITVEPASPVKGRVTGETDQALAIIVGTFLEKRFPRPGAGTIEQRVGLCEKRGHILFFPVPVQAADGCPHFPDSR